MAVQRSSRRIILIFCLGFGFSLSGCGAETSASKSERELSGEELFSANCATCHGIDGSLCSGGATDLTKSKISKKEIKTIVIKGKELMPPFDYVFKDSTELEKIIDYVNTLRVE